jgi:predicted GTPase
MWETIMADIDKVLKAYIVLRDKLDTIKKRQKEELADLEEKQAKLLAFLQKKLEEFGSDSLKVNGVGTVFKAKKSSIKIADKKEFSAWLMQQIEAQGADALGILTLSANKTSVLDYMDEHEDALPPGISYTTWIEAQVRRDTK